MTPSTTTNKSTAASMALLTRVLTTPMNIGDMEFEVNDPKFVDEFQAAWSKFLVTNPDLIPRGRKEDTIVKLQSDAVEVDEAKLKVLKEMEQQIEFFKASCDALEDVYASKMDEQIEKQKEIQDELKKRLDDVAIADHLQQQTLPWHHFIHEVEQAAKEAGESWDEEAESMESTRNTARPSGHARVLTDRSRGSASDILLRSYTIDHALLSAHIRILSKEVERYERMIRAQEMTGKFLRDQNAWAVLTKNPDSASSCSSSASSTTTDEASGDTSVTESHYG